MAAKLAKDLTLKGSSTAMPKLVYGTAWKKDRSADLVYLALKHGFRGVDTAGQPKHYNEKGVGEGVQRAIKEGLVKREGLFLQTKFSPPGNQDENAPYDSDAPLVDKIHQSIQSSLTYFTLEGEEPYFDSVLLHSPLRTLEETITAWKTLETYVPHKIRNLGISNTTLSILKAINEAVTVKPSVVQNRFYPDTDFEVDLRSYCREQGIAFQSFWTFSANPRLAATKPVKLVAEKAAISEVAAYYSLVLGLEGITVLDGTTTENHMKDDLEGIDKVAIWAETEGIAEWNSALKQFKQSIGEA